MSTLRTSKTSAQSARRKTSPANLAEEIERIQTLLRQLDERLSDRTEEVSLKELAQAVHTAGDGGRSIAQLRKFAKELETALQDEDTQGLRAGLLTLLDRLAERRASTPLPKDPGPNGGA